MKKYRDFCTTINQELFDIINERGSLLTWCKTWDSQGSQALPVGATGPYHGANVFHLLFTQFKEGLQSNQWLTFNQIKQKGGQVKKGAKSQKVFFWKLNAVTEDSDETKKGENKRVDRQKPIFKLYSVFNLEQTTLETSEHFLQERSIEALIQTLNINIEHYGNKAFYEAGQDVIVLPKPNLFNSKENYYATLLHELVHWTGGQERLPRACFTDYRRCKVARAKEELIAEIGSVFLALHFGLKAELENHASYVQSWKELLSEQDILQATHQAAKAFEWLLA